MADLCPCCKRPLMDGSTPGIGVPSLTPKQRALMMFLQSEIDAGRCPSFDEMAGAMGLASKSGIYRLLTGLEERGYIHRMAQRSRAISINRRVKGPTNA